MKNKLIIIFILLVALGASSFVYYNSKLSAVSKKHEQKIIEIPSGYTMKSVAKKLKDNKLIKDENIFLLHAKINKYKAQAGTYQLYTDYSAPRIAKMINYGKVFETNYWLKLIEGKTLKNYTKQYSGHVNLTEKEIIAELSDKEYLNSLINKYWFLTEDILNPEIYFPLEGYLFPDTYQFRYDDSLKTIINKQLNTLEKKLSPYKETIINKKINVHDLLTMASLVEKEANTKEDRDLVAGVFYNRIRDRITLGSDVTTYYAEQVEMGSVKDLYQSQYDASNAYNTRAKVPMYGLPVGPICNPSPSSIESAIKPAQTDYLFFYADKTGKVHFTKNNADHEKIIQKYR